MIFDTISIQFWFLLLYRRAKLHNGRRNWILSVHYERLLSNSFWKKDNTGHGLDFFHFLKNHLIVINTVIIENKTESKLSPRPQAQVCSCFCNRSVNKPSTGHLSSATRWCTTSHQISQLLWRCEEQSSQSSSLSRIINMFVALPEMLI